MKGMKGMQHPYCVKAARLHRFVFRYAISMQTTVFSLTLIVFFHAVSNPLV